MLGIDVTSSYGFPRPREATPCDGLYGEAPTE